MESGRQRGSKINEGQERKNFQSKTGDKRLTDMNINT